jgi:glycine/D-amino acid oxidase-like deaminating enzyme
MRVAVIGAGIVGASIAYRLNSLGAQVTLIDAGPPAGETSARSFAWLNSRGKHPESYFQLNFDGIGAHRRLAHDLGNADWHHPTGCLSYAATRDAADALVANVDRLHALGYPAESVTPARARDLEPAVECGSARAIGYFAAEGWADAPALVETLIAAVSRRGAEVGCWRAVVAIDSRADCIRLGIGTVQPGTAAHPRVAAGLAPALALGPATETVEVDRVVIASGRFADRVGALAGRRVPLGPTCGLLAMTAPIASRPSRVCYLPGVHLRANAAGGLVLQDNDTDDMVAPETPEDTDHPGVRLLLERAQQYLPALRGARIERMVVGIRALPADGHPLVGFLDAGRRVYLASTHSGVTLGPLLGEIAAAEIIDSTNDPRLASYRPNRLTTLL